MGVTVIVTGTGGPAGVNVVRALAGRARVVAADVDPSAVGLRLADEAAVLPRGDARGFVDAVCDLALASGARALISTVAEEMAVLGAAHDQLAAVGLASWLAPADAVAACTDKWEFACRTADAPVALPATALGGAVGVPGPWIVKPRHGRGSRDVWAVDDDEELAWAVRRVPEPIVQTRLTGPEFSVDTLTDRDGVLRGAVPRWRTETKAGISTKGTTFRRESVIAGTAALLGHLGLTGPANVQGFLADDGTPSFIEVNPRFSGGLALAQAAGADLVGEYLRAVVGDEIRPSRLTYREGVTMFRHFEEVFEG